MKIQEVMDIINNKPKGFMVDFKWCGDGFLRGDHFPDKHAGESLIPTEHEAWELADRFARATKGKTCDIYVVDSMFKPVKDYELRRIANSDEVAE